MSESMVERVTQAILREARENGADSPVDYGDAEQLARAAIGVMDLGPDERNLVITQYCQGRYERCTIDHVLQDVDDTSTIRLVKVLYERNLIDAQEVLDILRPRESYSAGPDQAYYKDREY